MQETQFGKWRVFTYDTWGEMVEHADKRVTFGKVNSSRQKDNEGYKQSWYMTDTWEDCVKLAIDGWEDGVKQSREIREKLYNRVNTLMEKTHVEFDVCGSEYDMAGYLTGVPECWSNTRDVIQEGTGYKHIRIVFNCVASAGVNSNVLMAKGAAVSALIELLEHAGHRVEVWLVHANVDTYLWRCVIKQAGQPLDMARLVFALAHPSSFRRIQFSLCESVKEFIKAHEYGYGQCCEAPKEYQGDVYIGSSALGQPQWTNQDSAVAWVTTELTRQGIMIEGLQAVAA